MTDAVQPTSGVTITIDPEALLQAFLPRGYNPETDEEYGSPVTEHLISTAARIIANEFKPGIENEMRLAIQAEIAKHVQELFVRGIQLTDTWVAPQGRGEDCCGTGPRRGAQVHDRAEHK